MTYSLHLCITQPYSEMLLSLVDDDYHRDLPPILSRSEAQDHKFLSDSNKQLEAEKPCSGAGLVDRVGGPR